MLRGPLPTPGDRLPHARAAAVRPASSSAPRTIPTRTTASSSSRPTAASCPTRVESDDRGARWSSRSRCKESASLGKARRVDDAAGRYIEFCKSTFPDGARPARHEASWSTARTARPTTSRRHVFHELGADVETIGVQPDGFNINDQVGATAPGRAAGSRARAQGRSRHRARRRRRPRADRATGSGRLYDGDELLYVIARERAKRRRG